MAAALGFIANQHEEVLSAAGGFLVVTLPHFFCVAQRSSKYAFSLWGTKFSVTVLLLAVVVRTLHTFGGLEADFLLAGVILALVINIFSAARMAARAS